MYLLNPFGEGEKDRRRSSDTAEDRRKRKRGRFKALAPYLFFGGGRLGFLQVQASTAAASKRELQGPRKKLFLVESSVYSPLIAKGRGEQERVKS